MAVARLAAGEVVEAGLRPSVRTAAGLAPAATRPWTAQAVDCEFEGPPLAEREAAVGALVARR